MQLRNKSTRFKVLSVLSMIMLPMMIVFAILVFSALRQKTFCEELAANHSVVRAQVTGMQMYEEHAKNRTTKTADAHKADIISMRLQYTINDQLYVKEFTYFYNQQVHLIKLHDLARTGLLDIAYSPSNPDKKVRPAFEFEPGAPTRLCEARD